MTTATAEPGIVIRGAPRELFRLDAKWQREEAGVVEACMDGGGGTGKSNGAAAFLWHLGHKYPGLRVLIVRKTRKSLSESFLRSNWIPTLQWLAPGHPILDGAAPEQRSSYDLSNGTHYALGGLNEPTRLFSTSWDVVFYNEAFEGRIDEWEEFRRGLRAYSGGIKYQLLFGDTNPRQKTHWLNQRMIEGRCIRLLSRHEDNPSLFAADGTPLKKGLDYLASLDTMTGVRYKRLRLHLWCAAEGQVWECWDEEKHIIDRPPGNPHEVMQALGISWCCVAVDWGFKHAGSMSVYGVNEKGVVYRLAQVYHTERNTEWWADRLVDLCDDWWPEVAVCDPSQPSMIDRFNEVLAERSPKRYVIDPSLPFARKANNQKTEGRGTKDMGGLDRVRQYLADGRLYFLRDSLVHSPDPNLRAAHMPTCTEEEIEGYVFAQDKVTGKWLEKTDKDVPDDGCDETRYAIQYVHGKARPEAPEVPPEPFGSIGGLLRPPSRDHSPRWDED